MVKKKKCIFCKEKINQGASICPHCKNPQKRLANKFRLLFGMVPFFISIVSLSIAMLSYNYSKTVSSRRVLLETLKEMHDIQDELQGINSDSTHFSQKEIFLLNYYEALSKTLAEYVDENRFLFKSAVCNHENSVRLREKPHPKAKQIGGIDKGDVVTLLGTYSRHYMGEEIVWHYIVTDKKQIGWAYKYFEEH